MSEQAEQTEPRVSDEVLVDLQGKLAVGAVMSATGIDPATMRFTQPALTVGNTNIYESQFASGWSSADFGLHGADTDRGDIYVRYGDPLIDVGLGPNGQGADQEASVRVTRAYRERS